MVGNSLSLLMVLIVLGATVGCQTSESSLPESEELTSQLDDVLVLLGEEYERYRAEGRPASLFEPSRAGLQTHDGYVKIDAIARKDSETLRTMLMAHGAINVSAMGLYVSCDYPIGRIRELTSIAELRFARPVYAATR